MKRDSATIRMHLWLENDSGVAFGMGRLLLLDALEQTGSLKGAAHKLGMSYRAAWGKLKNTELALGGKLLEKTGGNRSGYQLTPYGQEIKSLFEQWFLDVESLALERARDLFPFGVKAFTAAADTADNDG